MDPFSLTNDQSFNVRGTEIHSGDTRELYRQKIARITLDSMVQFVGLLDAHGIVLEINSVALDAVGITLSDVEGKPFWTTFWWQVSDEINATLRESIARAASGEVVRWDTPIYGRSGGKETIIIDASLCPVLDNSGKVVFICAEGRDITEKKAQERLIEEQNKDLQTLLERIRELDETRSQFFANVSHELRTPLSLIIGPADRLLQNDETITAMQRREYAQVISRNARLLLKHVNDLLDISKLDAGKLNIELHDTDVVGLVRLVASHFELLAEEQHISLSIESDNDVVASVDEEKLQRVLMNLLSNAFKFTPPAGKIRLQVRTEKNELVILVEDSGPGVKPEMRKAIFERFRQAEGGTNRQFGGTGLGLSIAKEFVVMHQGTLETLDSALGGACFQVKLPMVHLAQTALKSQNSGTNRLDQVMIEGVLEELRRPLAGAEAVPFETIDSGKFKVLVVEDNLDMNRFIAQCLSLKYHVIQAYDGQQGLDQALASMPDLVVTDIMMPKVSGSQMIAEIRKHKKLNNIPILLLTAKADEDLKIKLLKGGAQDFVAKPFSEEDLLVRVENLTTLKHSQEQLAYANKRLERSNEELELRVQERTRELEIARDDALRANELKSQFVANISHEIRTPMSGILGLSEVLVGETNGQGKETAQYVLSSASKLMSLLNDLLDISKLEAGRIDICEGDIRVDQIVDDVLTSLYISAKKKGLRLSQTVDSALLRDLRGDGDRIRQVLQNLLQNAIKFTDTGSIAIDVALREQQDGTSCVRFSVTDTGAGIAANDQEKLFQLFVQVDGSNTRRHGGTGLGLALSKRLVAMMGGSIGVDSAVGQGATFWFTLPLKVSPALLSTTD